MTELAWPNSAILIAWLPLLVLFAWVCRATPRSAFYILVAVVPWTVTTKIGFPSWAASDVGAGPTLALPLEPLMLVFAIIMLKELLVGRASTDPALGVVRRRLPPAVLAAPLTIVLAMQLLWSSFSTVGSVAPVVSVKHLLMKGLYWVVFYLGTLWVLSRFSHASDRSAVPQSDSHRTLGAIFLVLGWSLAPISFVVLLRHALQGFSRQATYEIAAPFFKSHIEWGALVALVLLMLIARRLPTRCERASRWVRFLPLLFWLLAIVLVDSFSRSAWLAFAAGLFFFVVAFVAPPPKATVAVLAVATVFGSLAFAELLEIRSASRSGEPLLVPAEVRVDSVLQSGFFNDESMAERFNRWRADSLKPNRLFFNSFRTVDPLMIPR